MPNPGRLGMLEDTSKGILTLFLWSFVPGFFASVVLEQYYKLRYSNSAARPKKGTPKYRKHYIGAYTTVMMIYFAYCVGQSVYDLPPNYYQKIGIQRLNVDTDLKSRFRSLVMILHPDKVPNADPQAFLEVKHFYETLENKDLRVAYETFGEGVLNSAASSSQRNKNARIRLRDVFESAFINWAVYYIGSLLVLLTLSFISRSAGIYWRLVGLLLCASVELYAMTSPHQTVAFDFSAFYFGPFSFLSKLTVYEKLVIFKSIVINFSMVVTQLLGLYNPPAKPVSEEILEITKALELTVNGPLKSLIENDKAEVSEVLEKDEILAKKFRNSLGKFIAQMEKDRAV